MPLRVRLKLLLKKLLPQSSFELILKVWRQTGSKLYDGKALHDTYLERFILRYGTQITGGPFAGMRYVTNSVGSTYLLKLIGCYEEILHPIIERLKLEKISTIIDIGCAEGYYLAGLGKSHPNAHLYGFDIDTDALKFTKELVEINQLKNQLSLAEICTHEKLTEIITPDTLLICDAEGFEEEILNPLTCSKLASVKFLLVELHEFARPGVTNELRARFTASHSITSIRFSMASPEKYEFLSSLNSNVTYELLRERGEQEQEWLFMERK